MPVRITVKVQGTLCKFLPAGAGTEAVLDFPDGARVADVIAGLGIPPEYAKLIISGDDQLEPAAVLHDGQEVNLFPPLAGGC